MGAIHNTLDYAVTNARVEATNTHLRQLTRRAYGFHSPDALIANKRTVHPKVYLQLGANRRSITLHEEYARRNVFLRSTPTAFG